MHGIFIGITAALILLTYSRNFAWVDEVTIWKDVVKKSPSWWRGYWNLGQELKNIGAKEETIRLYETAVQARGWDPLLWNNIGIVFFEMGLTDKAKEFILKSITVHLDKDKIDTIELSKAHNNLASIYYNEGKLNEAVKEQKMAIEINPSDYLYYYSLALILSDAGNTSEAIHYFKEFLKIAPPEAPRKFIEYANSRVKDLPSDKN